MSIITIGTPFNIDLEYKIAAFNKRLLAWLIDVIIICAYYYLMLRFIYPLAGLSNGISNAASLLAVIIPVMAYQLIFEMFLNGQTIGKIAAGIKVIDKEGREPTLGQYITRWILCIGNLFIYIIPYVLLANPAFMIFFMVLYLPDFLTMIISAKSQRIGDFAAGTVVIDKNYKANINETIYLQIETTGYKPLYPQVMRLTDRDINGIRNLLNTKRPSKQTENYTIDVAQKIKTVLGIESNMHSIDFLEKLLQDYNYFIKNPPNG
jgi:uncharacterized RDD family membrane protein YckC